MASKGNKNGATKVPATMTNRRARHDYELISHYEAGIVLAGSEVKSVAGGRVNLTDAYVTVREGEIWLVNMDVEPYKFASAFALERRRDRKLLLHRREIDVVARKSQEKGLVIIPLKVYFKSGKAKVEIALARGKKKYDKRTAIKEKDQRRELRKEGLV